MPYHHFRGFDLLSPESKAAYENAFAATLDSHELSRALQVLIGSIDGLAQGHGFALPELVDQSASVQSKLQRAFRLLMERLNSEISFTGVPQAGRLQQTISALVLTLYILSGLEEFTIFAVGIETALTSYCLVERYLRLLLV